MINKFLIILLTCLLSFSVYAQVRSQTAVSNTGTPIIRFFNPYPFSVGCEFRDSNAGYFTFVIPPRSFTMWYPMYGRIEWKCSG